MASKLSWEKIWPVRIQYISITDIPTTMEYTLHWPVAAALMRRWFNNPPHQMTKFEKDGSVDPSTLPKPRIDETIVKMDWLLRYGRVAIAYQQLIHNWRTDKGLKQLKKRLNKAGVPFRNECWRFGDLSQPAKVLEETCQVNINTFGSIFDPLDDLYGAIGKGTLNLAVAGTVTNNFPKGRFAGRSYRYSYEIAIDELAIYLRDTYDFNDDQGSWFSQPLGYWGFKGVERFPSIRKDISTAKELEWADTPQYDTKYEVQNKDFRAFRDRHHRGGDFTIFSDVKRIRLSKPLIIKLK